MKLFLTVYGIGVEVQTTRPEATKVIENLALDFAYFRTEKLSEAPKITLQIHGEDLEVASVSMGPKLFKTKLCDVYGWGAERFCDYGKGVWVKASNRSHSRHFSVYGKAIDLVYEAAYLALLSSVGEELDRHGYHRLHAVGLRINGRTIAVAADSGLGKSATAMMACQDSKAEIFSDEMPLIRDGRIFPFPIRIALHPQVAELLGVENASARSFNRKIYPTKLLFEIPAKVVAQSAHLDRLYLGISGTIPGARCTSWTEKLRFLFSFVMGLGLPQMSEHMIRLGNLFSLGKIAISRLRTGLRILREAQTQTITLSPDFRKNAQALTRESELAAQ